ncbi:MAG: PrgI family protein [Acidobacteria bacterium]|nr:PrgI family protein [Acidobacteriota bacterium]
MGITHTPRKLSWETQFLGGLNLRSLLILAGALPIAGSVIFTPIIPGPVWLHIVLGIGIAVLGLVMVFAKFSGRTFEQWVMDIVSWRWSGRRWIWRRGVSPPAGEVTITPGPTVRAVAARPEPLRTEDIAEPRYTVLGLAFNLVVILLLTGLTIYLAGGASAEIRAWWRALTAIR